MRIPIKSKVTITSIDALVRDFQNEWDIPTRQQFYGGMLQCLCWENQKVLRMVLIQTTKEGKTKIYYAAVLPERENEEELIYGKTLTKHTLKLDKYWLRWYLSRAYVRADSLNFDTLTSSAWPILHY